MTRRSNRWCRCRWQRPELADPDSEGGCKSQHQDLLRHSIPLLDVSRGRCLPLKERLNPAMNYYRLLGRFVTVPPVAELVDVEALRYPAVGLRPASWSARTTELRQRAVPVLFARAGSIVGPRSWSRLPRHEDGSSTARAMSHQRESPKWSRS